MVIRLRNVVLSLIGVNVAMFFLQMVLGDAFTYSFLLLSEEVWSRPWIIVTSMFLHGSPMHLLFNMYGLFLFGTLLEQQIGSKKILFVYFASGIFAGIMSTFFYSAVLGASGALMGVIGTLIIVMPNLRLLFLFAIPMPLWVAGIIWVAIDTFGILIPSNTANIAHLAGIGFGLLYGLYLTKQTRKYPHGKRSKPSQELDVDEYLRSGRF